MAARQRWAVRLAATGSLGLVLASLARPARESSEPGGPALSTGAARVEGCLQCHEGIEPMHPEAELSCVDCHGGDPAAKRKNEAHVTPQRSARGDERVAELDDDLRWRRFQNPMDLRVAETTCGTCHEEEVRRVLGSLHATTAGHLSDGYYEMGLSKRRGSRWSVFPVHAHMGEAGEVDELDQVPPYRGNGPRDRLSTHYADLPRKECMQCHLWSEGRAVRGRVGFDGDYRGAGCAACHVAYATDGLSESGDGTVPRNEPGHPRVHAMTAAPSTQTCTSCHYGDASIGLSFRGLSQLPPGAPGGPDIPGTTDSPLNRVFYLNDASMVPPDLHHQAGMNCIDCHTQNDVMGDGVLHGQMEHAVEISCSDCHGSLTEPADRRTRADPTIRTQRGTVLEQLQRQDGQVYLVSKVTGERHRVKQVADVLDPEHPDYNARAARAMNADHARLECYACHSSWNVNFLGFHFDRNESLTQLDLLSGLRTPGRVTTQEKVFATWKSFYAGWDSEGRIAPYLTGFSTMGTVRDREGRVILDQVLPQTAAGLSGLTMIHHQTHTNRRTARSCVECHRSSSTWGMGSPNFRLGRQLAFVADRRGIEVVALRREQLAASSPLAKLVLPDVVDLELQVDPIQGQARTLFATEGYRGLHVIDVRDPLHPRRIGFQATINPRGMALSGDHLFLADGVGGLLVFDVSDPEHVRRVGQLPLFDAHEVAIQWPWAYVADGLGGLSIVDVRAPIAPKLVGGTRLSDDPSASDAAIDVAVLFQYSRPRALRSSNRPVDRRTEARNLCAVLDENRGLVLIDATEPAYPRVLYPAPAAGRSRARPRGRQLYRALELASHVDLAEAQGGTRTAERDYAYLLVESIQGGARRSRVEVVDVSEPRAPETVGRQPAGFATESLELAWFYNAPFLQTVLLAPGERGLLALDASVSAEPNPLGALAAIGASWALALEEFPLDQMVDGAGRPLKDVSHEGARWLYRAEIERILDVPGEVLGSVRPGAERSAVPGATARLYLERLDRDRNGVLEGEEYEAAGGARVDADGDGRIVLAELAGMAGLAGRESEVPPEDEVYLRTRTDPDGDLARLLDGTNPYEHDRDGDRRLDRKEMRAAMFAALDLDEDDRLSPMEMSRHPGRARLLRFGGDEARRLFREWDTNRDGRLTRREFRLRDEDWKALDADGDGGVQLYVYENPWWVRLGLVGPESEWPTRQPVFSYLPPVITVERVFETFDADGDGRLSLRELARRPDLVQELDTNGDDVVTREEVERRVDLVGRLGVDATADAYLPRWDLDGNGRVEGAEIPPGAELRVAPTSHR